MARELTRKRAPFAGRLVGTLVAKAPLERLTLAVVLILSSFLNLFHLMSLGYGNTYYAAAVKDMLTNWSNFFFVSFDAGFISVDKPRLGLWIQAASAYLFGFHGLSLLLPQAIAGVLSVAVLYYLVRRTFGPVAGLLAALALALTPIIVATSRNNIINNARGPLHALGCVGLRARHRKREPTLVDGGAVVMGLGFNKKTLQTFSVLPAFYLLYLLAARTGWWRRFVHLGLATLVVVVSLFWAIAVELTPSDQRPYDAATVGVLVLLVAPMLWASYNVLQGGGGGGPMVAAGPQPPRSGGGPGGGPGGPPPGGGGPGGPGGPGGNANSALVDYLQANKGDAKYLVATTDSHSASSLILNTDEKVIDMNGFEGHDPVFTDDELANLVNDGKVRFFLVGGGGPGGSNNGSAAWVQDNCQQIPQEEWQSSSAQGGGGPPGRAPALYECSAGASQQ